MNSTHLVRVKMFSPYARVTLVLYGAKGRTDHERIEAHLLGDVSIQIYENGTLKSPNSTSLAQIIY